jgi:hypothetical protein
LIGDNGQYEAEKIPSRIRLDFFNEEDIFAQQEDGKPKHTDCVI